MKKYYYFAEVKLSDDKVVDTIIVRSKATSKKEALKTVSGKIKEDRRDTATIYGEQVISEESNGIKYTWNEHVEEVGVFDLKKLDEQNYKLLVKRIKQKYIWCKTFQAKRKRA